MLRAFPAGQARTRTVAVVLACAAGFFLTPRHVKCQSTRDSAGVQIVESARPLWTAGQAWRLSATPVFRTELDAGPAGAYHLIQGMVRLSDGRVAVGNSDTYAIVFYDSTGRRINSVGRRGQGPGEFVDLRTVCRAPGDTLVAFNYPIGFEVFTSTGTPVRTVRSSAPWIGVPPSTPDLQGCLSDGTYIMMGTRGVAGMSGPTNPWVDSVAVQVVDRAGQLVRTFGPLPAANLARQTGGRGMMDVTFSARATKSVGGRQLFYGFPDKFNVQVFTGEGKLLRIIRRAWTPVPVTSALIGAYKDFQIAAAASMGQSAAARGLPADMAASMRRRMDEAIFARTYPAFKSLIADAAGGVWVEDGVRANEIVPSGTPVRAPQPTRWSVFDAAGRWLGDVQMPARFTPIEIGVDYVLGLSRDDDELKYVTLYRIERPPR